MTDKGETYKSVWRYLMTTPFKQDYVMAGGLRTRYVQAGKADAPAVVMLHGTGGHWEAFCANLGPFSEHFNCYALDMMGCGFTDKPDKPYEIFDYVDHVLSFMDELSISHAAFLGVSLGSWVAARLALKAPDRADKLILVAPSGLLQQPPSASVTTDARRASAADPSWDKIAAVLANLFYGKQPPMDDLIAVRQRVYSLPGLDKIMPRMLTLFDPAIRARNNLSESEWRSIRTPTLIAAHVDSPDIYLETGRKLVDLMPDARIVEMFKTSHWSQYEDAEKFNKFALEFLTERQ